MAWTFGNCGWTAQSVHRLTTGSTVWRSNPSRGESFRQGQTGPEAHPASCTISKGSFPGVKWLESGADHPPPSHVRLLIVWICNSSSPLCLHRHIMRWPLSLHQGSSASLIPVIFGFVQVVIKNGTQTHELWALQVPNNLRVLKHWVAQI
jgi:hypothetical protein